MIRRILLAILLSLPLVTKAEIVKNPIVSGDWSDPGIIRVGEDYYSVRSTFGWQPGLQIMHSKDLVHWEYIGHAMKGSGNPELAAGEVWGGVWGSDIIYNTNTQRFQVFAPIYDRLDDKKHKAIYVFTSKRPEGPYSSAVQLLEMDIDPGVFIDRDGSLYMSSKKSVIYQLSRDGMKIEREVSRVKGANGKAFGEGAEIVYHNGYYYYTCSQGGTLPYEHHKILSYRAKSLEGPWEADPDNPKKYAPHTTKAPIQGPGHGELVQTQNGEWFLTYHAFELSYPTLARQMCIEPIKWDESGWWQSDAGVLPATEFEAPNLPISDIRLNQSDEFSDKDLGAMWFFHTTPDYSGKQWQLNPKQGDIELMNYIGERTMERTLERFVMQRMEGQEYTITTKVDFTPSQDGECAGLLMYVNKENYIQYGLTKIKGVQMLQIRTKCGAFDRVKGYCRPIEGKYTTLKKLPVDQSELHLKIEVVDPETARFYYSVDGREWLGFDDYELFFGRGGAPDLGWQFTYWTGGTIGIFIDSERSMTQDNSAKFDYFRVDR
ncbi:MAG: family 43 glycosylhydrolase [Rikenellaceae bacterium]